MTDARRYEILTQLKDRCGSSGVVVTPVSVAREIVEMLEPRNPLLGDLWTPAQIAAMAGAKPFQPRATYSDTGGPPESPPDPKIGDPNGRS